jgi:hypothetical protein
VSGWVCGQRLAVRVGAGGVCENGGAMGSRCCRGTRAASQICVMKWGYALKWGTAAPLPAHACVV